MNKKSLCACLISLCAAPCAFAKIGSGFYMTLGAGAGFIDVESLESFDLNYPDLYQKYPGDNDISARTLAVIEAFNNSAESSSETESVLAGRAAIGYMWDFFDGEPKKMLGAIYTVNATLGLELGYRIFDSIDNSHTETEIDESTEDPFEVIETASNTVRNQAIDLTAVLRLPFTMDNKLALLLKGGVAYNIYDVSDTTLSIRANPESPIELPGYDMDVDLGGGDTYREWLPTFAVGLEYMLFKNFGLSAEYNVITGSSHDADTQLILANAVFRL